MINISMLMIIMIIKIIIMIITTTTTTTTTITIIIIIDQIATSPSFFFLEADRIAVSGAFIGGGVGNGFNKGVVEKLYHCIY